MRKRFFPHRLYHVPKPFLFWETDYPLAAGSDALHRSGFRVEF